MRIPRHSMPFLLMALASGAAALVYESIWLRWFKILFGSTAYATSATLAAFFAGLSIGAMLFGRLSQRTHRPLWVYGWLEICIIATAFLVPFAVDAYDVIYPYIYENLSEHRATFLGVKFSLAFFAMLPTAILIGGTLPLIVRSYVHHKATLGEEGNRLYSINTFGGAIGSFIGALWLPEILGITLTYGVGMLLSLAAAIIAFAVNPKLTGLPATDSSEDVIHRTPPSLLLIAAASGFGTLALEVLLIHTLSQLFDNSIYSFGAILIVVLIALAAGAAFVSLTTQRFPIPILLRAVLIMEAGMLIILPWLTVQLMAYFGAIQGTLLNGLVIAALLGGPVLFVGGLVFPLTFRLAENGAAGRRIGGLLAANTLGGIAGSIVAGFLLLEAIGLWQSLAMLGIAYGIAAIIVEGNRIWRFGSVAVIAIMILSAMFSSVNPRILPVVSISDEELLIDSAQGAHGVVSVINRPIYNDFRIKINNHYTLSGSGAKVNVERAGHLPLLLHPDPKTVAFIGSATGITAGAATLHAVKNIELIELVPEVQAFASSYFGDHNRNVYQDPRTKVIVEDGRNHLRATQQEYDVIVADLFVPWRPGVGSMYTRDHFQVVKSHLREGGIFCQWLPIFQLAQSELDVILATFLDVFPDATLWRGNFSSRLPRLALIARNGSWLGATEIEHRIKNFEESAPNRWISKEKAIWMLYMGPLSSAAPQSVVTINTDNLPVFEYMAGRSSSVNRENFLKSGWLLFGERLLSKMPALPAGVSDWPLWGRDAGQMFARADAYFVEDRKNGLFSASATLRNTLAELHRLAPEELLVYDPTIAEVKQ